MIFLISSFSLISGKHFIMYSRGDRSSSSCSVRCCNTRRHFLINILSIETHTHTSKSRTSLSEDNFYAHCCSVKGKVLLKYVAVLMCRQSQCLTWWYLPILTWECLRIMPSEGRSYKKKKGYTWIRWRPGWCRVTYCINLPLPSATSAVWISLLHWVPPEPLVYPSQYQTPGFYICAAIGKKKKSETEKYIK